MRSNRVHCSKALAVSLFRNCKWLIYHHGKQWKLCYRGMQHLICVYTVHQCPFLEMFATLITAPNDIVIIFVSRRQLKNVSESMQKMLQSRRKAFPRHQRSGDGQQIMTKQIPYMKPRKHKERRTATEEPPWNGQ